MSANGRNGDLPDVTIHYAQTLDGRIATHSGHSQWISGSAALELAHQLRASHSAVMVGVGTVVSDDPRLTVRLCPGPCPRRIIVDSTLRIPLDAHVLTDGEAPTLIATTDRASAERLEEIRGTGAEVIIARQDLVGCVDLRDLFTRLSAMGLDSLLIEGGRGLITSAFASRLVDRLVVCIAPKVIGAGIEAVGDLNIVDLGEALTFTESSFSTLGDDIIFEGQLDPGA